MRWSRIISSDYKPSHFVKGVYRTCYVFTIIAHTQIKQKVCMCAYILCSASLNMSMSQGSDCDGTIVSIQSLVQTEEQKRLKGEWNTSW